MTEMKSVNPATGETVATYPVQTGRQLGAILRASERAYRAWSRTTVADRAAPMRRAARILRDRADEYGQLMAVEMGKPVAGGRAEAQKCAWVCDYYAEHADAFLEDEAAPSDGTRSYVAYRPLGPVLAIMPWNFPFWQVFRFAAPALMAGNTGLLKHAPNVAGCALAIERVFEEAGFPKDVFRALLIDTPQVKNAIRNPRVAAVTLTGSTRAGRAVAKAAGQHLKKTVLELGGSDPYVVLEDADVALAAETCATSRLVNGGQSCIAAKRFIVVDAVREAFTEQFVEHMRAARMGDPLTDGVDLGPMARLDLRDTLHEQVTATVAGGARLLLGGEVPDGPGAFYPPTVLTDVPRGTPAYEEELFGPVAAILPARDEGHALEIANDTAYGLGAAVFTGDPARGEQIARDELQAGACFVNAFVKSDPRLPFGGIRESGYGRELSHFGIREFVNVKTVYVA